MLESSFLLYGDAYIAYFDSSPEFCFAYLFSIT
jgi:hypothetical protein